MWEKLKALKLNFLLASVLYVILGLVLLLRPGSSGIFLCRALGGALLLYGLLAIVGFLHRDSEQGVFKLELFFGIIAASVGAVFLLVPTMVLSMFSIIVGVYVIVDSVLGLQRAAELRRLEYPWWWAALLLGLGGVILGGVLIARPFAITEAVFRLTGAVFVYLGCTDLWSLYQVSSLVRELRKRAPIEVDPIDVE